MTTSANRFVLALGVIAGLSVATPVFADLTVGGYTLVGVERVSRFEFEYTYTAEVRNTDSEEAMGVMAIVSSTTPNVMVVEGDVWFGAIGASATARSADTFTVRHDRRAGFDGALATTVFQYFNGSNLLGLSIPPTFGWYAQEETDYIAFRNVAVPAPYSEWKLETESYFEIYRHIGINRELRPISDWVADYSPLLPTPVQSTEHLIVGGREAVRIVISEMGGNRAHTYVPDGPDILDIHYGLYEPRFIAEYEAILASLSFQTE
jgi:hypothetical protein